MSGFSKAVSGSREYQEIKNNIEQHRFPFGVLGTANIHKACLIHSLLADTEKRAIVLVPDEGTASRLAGDLVSLGTEAAVFPARELSFIAEQTRSREYEQRRMGALSAWLLKNVQVVLMPVEAAMQKTIPPQELGRRILTLKQGAEVNLDKLLASFVNAGYTHADEVEGPGQFAVRGGIVDFFPPDRENPLRMEFWGDEIDTISEFETKSQRRTDTVKEVQVTPPGELIIGDRGALADTIETLAARVRTKNKDTVKSKMQDEADAIRNGRELCLDKYINLIYPMAATPLSYLQNGDILFLAESGQIRERANAVTKLSREEIKDAYELGNMTRSLGDLTITYSMLTEDYGNADTVFLDNFARGSFELPLKDLYSLTLATVPSWNGTLTSLFDDCLPDDYQEQAVVLAAGTEKAAKSLAEDLQQRDCNAVPYTEIPEIFPRGQISVIPRTFSSGVSFPKSRFLLVSHGGVASGSRRKIRRPKSANAFHSLDELHKGDYIVHSIHGIGVFEGIENLTVSGVTKDFIKIRYAKGDTLYVPVTQLDLVSKYIGPREESHTVKINRLGSKEWEKSRAKVRSAVKDIAKELTQLYAERMNTKGYAFSPDIDMQSDFERRFEYDETEDQLRCIQEIKEDMEKPYPMDRLLCGDVGFGKTEVALRAAFKCIADGKQCAFLVPTTILAFQHYNTIMQRFDGFPVNIEMLSRFKTPTEQKNIIKEIRRGSVDIVVGTHRLISKDVEFHDLGLLIVDEEQRFGVAQKEKLKQKFPNVDVLTLSATPIPRTLNMAMTGIRDMSILEEAPLDRHPVQTYVLEYDAGVITEAIERELRRGGQVYYMHNNVDSIMHCAAKIHEMVPDARIGVAHGKMSEDELSDVWRDLVDGDIDVLVCTTIIETGVDVPNANTLIIENADRLGLSQLHQIRGRIGRSSRRASAYFTFYGGKELTDIAARRLSAIREYTEFGSGFKIAMRDLELRGAGNILGAQQHGHMEAVGDDMYLKLLGEAINGEKAGKEEPEEEPECLIDLQMDAHIPENYISSIPNRLSMYRRIAEIRTEEDASDVIDELVDRFGDPPKPVEGLIQVSLLRNTAAQLGIYEVGQSGKELRLYSNDIDLNAVMRLNSDFPRQIRVRDGQKPYVSVSVPENEVPMDLLKKVLLVLTAYRKEQQMANKGQDKG